MRCAASLAVLRLRIGEDGARGQSACYLDVRSDHCSCYGFLSDLAHRVQVKKKETFSETDEHLSWEEMWSANISLDESKTWMTVQEAGVYLVYVQLTYSLTNSSSVDLSMGVEFSYAEREDEFIGAFDTRQATEKEQDAHLSKFFLLHMKAGNRLAIKAHPKERLKYDDVRPFSSYITIVQYADRSG
ncbi:hypothetical protein Baya_0464 [Bagarius yarrelli]|uniref:THD domain-containing protein n=1 Tax=Bagarius yarrelli TaxID=175774 RepID=A0A556TID4_BAGYA|nr:hypothetical protein Baya_0464 [Bagarius yarrelli]